MAWQAPEDMPDDMVVQVLAGKMCGALKRKITDPTKKYCRSRNVIQRSHGYPPPFRCKLHAGASTGPKRGTQNNLKHGIYAQAVLPGEEELFEQIKVGTVDEEIQITKLRLVRAVKAEAEAEARLAEGEKLDDLMVTEQREDSSGYGTEGPTASSKEIKKLPDFKRIIGGIITQLVKLENQKHIMESSNGAGAITPEENAARARAFLVEARETLGAVNDR